MTSQKVRISKISRDWIVKGCHVHVGSVELALRPDHRGGIMMESAFARTGDKNADPAIRVVWEWLADVGNQRRLRRAILGAREYARTETGLLSNLARGRGAEFTFLLQALARLGN